MAFSVGTEFCCCCSVAKARPTLGDPTASHVLHCLLEFAQTHVHWVSAAIQSSPTQWTWVWGTELVPLNRKPHTRLNAILTMLSWGGEAGMSGAELQRSSRYLFSHQRPVDLTFLPDHFQIWGSVQTLIHFCWPPPRALLLKDGIVRKFLSCCFY